MNFPDNKGKAWTPGQNQLLQKLVKQNTPTRIIGLKTGRTPSAIYSQASKLDLSVKPTNQRPYGKQK